MNIKEWIELILAVVVPLGTIANSFVVLLVKYEVAKLKNEIGEKFLSKEDFTRYTATVLNAVGASPVSHRRMK